MKIIAFVNQKGGVGKTTTCYNVGAGLAAAGKKVLLVDTDPQGSLSLSTGTAPAEGQPTVYEVLKGSTDINQAIVSAAGGYDVLPADIMLSGADIELAGYPGRELIMKEAFAQIQKEYDFILIDCPPSLSVITLMGLTAANTVVVPVQAHYLALNGLAQLVDTIGLVRRRMNPQLTLGGIVITQYDNRLLLHRQVVQNLDQAFPGKLCETRIGNCVALTEAPSFHQSIFEYKPKSKAAEQYKALTAEILINQTNPDRVKHLKDNWGNESNQEETQEWREDLTPEEQTLVDHWDKNSVI